MAGLLAKAGLFGKPADAANARKFVWAPSLQGRSDIYAVPAGPA